MEDSPLTQMRYIRGTFVVDEYIQLIHDVLYENNPDTTVLLKAISQLCRPSRKHIGVKSVITYNFDDLVERILENDGIKHTSIYRDTDISINENLNIYHVHGYLR